MSSSRFDFSSYSISLIEESEVVLENHDMTHTWWQSIFLYNVEKCKVNLVVFPYIIVVGSSILK